MKATLTVLIDPELKRLLKAQLAKDGKTIAAWTTEKAREFLKVKAAPNA